MNTYRYYCFGQHFESDIEFPECYPSEGSDNTSIATMRQGDVPTSLPSAQPLGRVFQGDSARILFSYPNIGRFLVESGEVITYAPHSHVRPEAIRSILLGPVMAALLLQRGRLVLHASACATLAGAVLVAGYSGRGKSTVAAALVARGFSLVADDISVISLDESSHPVVHQAGNRIRARPDVIEHLKLTGSVPTLQRESDKFSIPLGPSSSGTVHPIRGLFILNYQGDDVLQVSSLSGTERMENLLNQVYLKRMVEAMRLSSKHFTVLAGLAAQTPVTLISRQRGFSQLDAVLDCIGGQL